MDQVVKALREERTPWVAIALILGIALGGFVWASSEHEDVDESVAEVRSLVKTTLEELRLHVEDFKIRSATQAVRDAKRDIVLAEQDPQASQRELHRLREELVHAQEYKECLVMQRPNCKHVKEPE